MFSVTARLLRQRATAALEAVLAKEQDERVALEAAGSAARLGSSLGQNRIAEFLWGAGRADLRMEAVLILTELANRFAKDELVRVASDPRFGGDEVRQAAVWGLGKTGMKAYDELLPFIADPDQDVALHAIVAFSNDTPERVIRALVQELRAGDQRRAAAASEALRIIGGETVLRVLIEAAATGQDWVLATLGRLPPSMTRAALSGSALLQQLTPMLLLGEGANWLASDDRIMDIAFLAKQSVCICLCSDHFPRTAEVRFCRT